MTDQTTNTKPANGAVAETTTTPVAVASTPPVDLQAEGLPTEAEAPAGPKFPFEWKGVTYDFADYDDVVMWQTGRGPALVQHCEFRKGGKKVSDIPVADHGECLQVEQAFHAVMPRLHTS
jgi:hypothetical protein